MSILDKINEKLDKLKNAFLPLSMRDITKLNLVQLNTRLNDIQKNITSYKNSNKQKRDELIRK